MSINNENISNAEVILQPFTVGGKQCWRIITAVDYKTKAGELIVVPSSTITDLASVPRVLWPILPPFGRYTAAAVIHDWLYLKQPVSRLRADNIFLEVMRELGVSWATRSAMWSGVRVGGWLPWRRAARRAKS